MLLELRVAFTVSLLVWKSCFHVFLVSLAFIVWPNISTASVWKMSFQATSWQTLLHLSHKVSLLHTITSRYRGKAPVTWRTTWRSRWTTLTPSPCRNRASHQQNAGRTCTSCSISTPSSLIPLGFWRKAPQRTA